MRNHARVGTAAAGLGAALLAWGWVPAAQAADPPDSWANQRLLDCEGTAVESYLTPAGFGSTFHVVGSTDIIKPKHVEVVFPGTTARVTTLDVPGFDRNGLGTVHCTYTDTAGLFVDFVGVRR